jgi:hypothetical protein
MADERRGGLTSGSSGGREGSGLREWQLLVGGRKRQRGSSDGSGRATASGGRQLWAGDDSGRATRGFGRATAPDVQWLWVGDGLVAEREDGGEDGGGDVDRRGRGARQDANFGERRREQHGEGG